MLFIFGGKEKVCLFVYIVYCERGVMVKEEMLLNERDFDDGI